MSKPKPLNQKQFISDSSRDQAWYWLCRMEQGAWSNRLLSADLKHQAASDSSAAALRVKQQAEAWFYLALSHQPSCDWLLDQLGQRPAAKLDPGLRNALRLALARLNYDPAAKAYAEIYETVDLVKRQLNSGAAGYANAILRAYQRRKPDLSQAAPWIQLNVHPDLFRDLTEQLGAAMASAFLAQTLTAPLPLCARLTKRGKAQTAATLASLEQEDVGCSPAVLLPEDIIYLTLGSRSLTSLSAFKDGLIYLQGEASALPLILAAMPEGASVLDVCAAPGGKTIQAAEAVGPQGRVLAAELKLPKLALIKANLRRLGLKNVEVIQADATRPRSGSYDYVIADVPCSGLGLLWSRPELRLKWEAAAVQRLQLTQAQILRQAAQNVKPGGLLIYSTCTVRKAENQDQIETFLADPQFKGRFRLLPAINLAQRLPDQVMPARTRELLQQQTGALILPPAAETEGFYMAFLRREA
ncbi:methyltransferase domain-containing protein [Oscillospiraceae bacterium HV4-5-C5C]|nr:methyltransferase domain-containing protein [Oscillospiraceae bacterium HV4-5-C5C]